MKGYFTKRGRNFLLGLSVIFFCLIELKGERHIGLIDHYESALAQDPKNPEIMLRLANAYYNRAIHLSAYPEEARPLLEGAITLYEDAAKLKEGDPEIAFWLGRCYFKRARYSQEEDDFYRKAQKYLSFAERNGLSEKELFVYLGHSLLLTGFLDEAISVYKKGADFYPDEPVFAQNLAWCYKEKREEKKAELWLKKAGSQKLNLVKSE